MTTPEQDNFIAIVSLIEMVVLKPALNSHGHWDADEHRRRVFSCMTESSRLRVRIALSSAPRICGYTGSATADGE